MKRLSTSLVLPCLVQALLFGVSSVFLTVPAAAAPANDFMVLVEDDRGSQATDSSGRATTGALVRLDAAALLEDPATLAIPLPDGRVLTAVRDGAARRDLPELAWSGRLEDDPASGAGVAPGTRASNAPAASSTARWRPRTASISSCGRKAGVCID